jgi:hypothetical protein
MRRKTLRVVINLIIFFSLLTLIITLNRPGSSTSLVLSWGKIQYNAKPAPNEPAASGVCPGLAITTKPALIVARVDADGDTSWLDSLAGKYHICIYTADSTAALDPSSTLRVPANRGHEAMAYLTFLIDNYHTLPASGAVFVHGTRFSWHNDDPSYDNLALLTSLNVSNAVEPAGYHNMRCDWSAGTCPPNVKAQGSLETRMQAKVAPWELRTVADAAIPAAFAQIFGQNVEAENVLLGSADVLRSQCCAQFVVSRDSIWQHKREEYLALRAWLMEAAPDDDRVSGRILSYLWHVLFVRRDLVGRQEGEVDLGRLNAIACPSAEACYCRLYGRCGLPGCREGRCQGQYKIPPNYALPKDWEETHA